ncbi:MAG: carbohydrate kinase family protein [Thermoguttaceae bacterium]|nr:carbohydrate kinase family protein [Thermoguttaceae bacterium]MDW8037781.1 carbohydrate kinase family protein [Thermoguttaceae bacterium]
MEIDCLCMGILFADVTCAPIPRLPNEGELIVVDQIQLALGGCASNTALDLVKLGVRVGVSGCVGEDPFGRVIVEALQKGGVDTSGVHTIPDKPSACTMIINVQGQDRRFISTPGANTLFGVEHVPTQWLQQAKVIYVGGFFMLPKLETQETVELFRRVRAAGVKTVLDVVMFGPENYWDRLAPLLPEIDVFVPNDHEGALITGLKDPLDQANRFREAGAKTVVITMGSQGSLLVTDGLRVRAGVYPVEFVGGAGSGDAFDAGFIAGMLAGEDPVGCLRWGSALGASCVRSITTTDSVFTRPEAERFMQENQLPLEIV